MKRIICIFVLAIVASFHPQALALPPVKTDPSLVPKTNYVTLSIGSGEIASFGSNGVILRITETNGTKFTPRTHLKHFSDADAQALLYTKLIYESLAMFRGATNPTVATRFPRPTQSAQPIEERLRKIWERGESLQEKMYVRFDILQNMKVYNEAALKFNFHYQVYYLSVGRDILAQGRKDDAATLLDDDRLFGVRTLRNLETRRQWSQAKAELQQNQQLQAEHGPPMEQWRRTYLSKLEALKQSGFDMLIGMDDTQPLTEFAVPIPELNISGEVDRVAQNVKFAGTLEQDSAIMEKIFQLVEKADKGDSDAQCAVGLAFLKGEGLPKDDNAAKAYLEKAAAQGNSQAKEALSKLAK